jgi:hypothetical protein
VRVRYKKRKKIIKKRERQRIKTEDKIRSSTDDNDRERTRVESPEDFCGGCDEILSFLLKYLFHKVGIEVRGDV